MRQNANEARRGRINAQVCTSTEVFRTASIRSTNGPRPNERYPIGIGTSKRIRFGMEHGPWTMGRGMVKARGTVATKQIAHIYLDRCLDRSFW